MMDIYQFTGCLDLQWDSEGFLGQLRDGHYVPDAGRDFLELLKQIEIKENDLIPKRLVSLLWYLPIFLLWQADRIYESGGNSTEYKLFVNQVTNILEDRLGVP
jgi:hypothetical protein